MITIEELAREVLEMFEAQKRYFAGRGHVALIESKKLESALKKKCEAILSAQKGLFKNGA
jgi:hypothetical protein